MTDTRYALDEILREALHAGATDVHLASGAAPRYRSTGRLIGLAPFPRAYGTDELRDQLVSLMDDTQRASLEHEHDVELAHTFDGVGRFRISVYRTLDGIAATLRHIPSDAPRIEHLGVPVVVAELATATSGLVIVAGPAGSGTSTTVAALVDIINTERDCHIHIIEHPVEIVHPHKRGLITQRDIGPRPGAYADALRQALRHAPDVIVVGDLRDADTIELAIAAVEAGNLVLAAVHAPNAVTAVSHLVDAFPEARQAAIRARLARTLSGVVGQHLVPRADGIGRVLAPEVLVRTSAVAEILREGTLSQLVAIAETGVAGMQTGDQAVRALVAGGVVARREAEPHLVNPHVLDDIAPLERPVPELDPAATLGVAALGVGEAGREERAAPEASFVGADASVGLDGPAADTVHGAAELARVAGLEGLAGLVTAPASAHAPSPDVYPDSDVYPDAQVAPGADVLVTPLLDEPDGGSVGGGDDTLPATAPIPVPHPASALLADTATHGEASIPTDVAELTFDDLLAGAASTSHTIEFSPLPPPAWAPAEGDALGVDGFDAGVAPDATRAIPVIPRVPPTAPVPAGDAGVGAANGADKGADDELSEADRLRALELLARLELRHDLEHSDAPVGGELPRNS